MPALRMLALLGLLAAIHGWAGVAAGAPGVDIYATVVALRGTTLVVEADRVRLELDVAEIDPRFLQALRPGDEVRIAAFRLPDGGLLVHSIFLQAPGDVVEDVPTGPQGGPD